jgi:inhibitor of growth protein 3
MHYYEDYLEIIEYLPAELKSRLSRICEQDEYVQAQLHSISDKTKTFFTLCRKDKSALRDHQYQQLCKEYDKTVKESQEKVKLATQVYDLLERHMRRLEHDLNRFTIELEADTAGITEILEQRSYMLDRPPSPERPPLGQKRTRHTTLLQDDILTGDFEDYSPTPSLRTSPIPSNRPLKFSKREKVTTAFADEVDFLDFDDHLTPPSELYTGSGGKPLLPFHLETKAHRKKNALQQSLLVSDSVQESAEWLEYVDPNEPRYCLCNQVSYGEMVGCDNAEVSKVDRIARLIVFTIQMDSSVTFDICYLMVAATHFCGV